MINCNCKSLEKYILLLQIIYTKQKSKILTISENSHNERFAAVRVNCLSYNLKNAPLLKSVKPKS